MSKFYQKDTFQMILRHCHMKTDDTMEQPEYTNTILALHWY